VSDGFYLIQNSEQLVEMIEKTYGSRTGSQPRKRFHPAVRGRKIEVRRGCLDSRQCSESSRLLPSNGRTGPARVYLISSRMSR